MLHYRIGEYQARNKQFEEAARSFGRVGRSHGFRDAKYQEALAFAEINQLDRALQSFEELYQARSSAQVTDKARVLALMGKARVNYQRKAWDEAIEAYREVPRDSEILA